MPIIVVTGKEIEKIKGDFESYLNGLNMVGEISYSQYSELYDEGTKQIQRAYELGKSDLEKENAKLKAKLKEHESIGNAQFWENVWSWKTKAEQLTKAKNLLAKWVELYKPKLEGYPITPIQEQTEQFLSEVEK